jgi:HPt (histidine-containing phosphotransfer) domain-containing protein
VRAVAHSVKGSEASFGFPALSKQAEQVQFSLDEVQIDKASTLAGELLAEIGKLLP